MARLQQHDIGYGNGFSVLRVIDTRSPRAGSVYLNER